MKLVEWWDDNFEVDEGVVATVVSTAKSITKPRVLTRLEVQPTKVLQAALPKYLQMYFEVARYSARRSWHSATRVQYEAPRGGWCCSERAQRVLTIDGPNMGSLLDLPSPLQ